MIEELIEEMAVLLESLRATGDQRQYFHATYQRTTIAVAAELRRGGFLDADWVRRWDVAFADLYLDALRTALAGGRPTRPWDVAFSAPAQLPPLRHVLLGMNAHINYDLPQAWANAVVLNRARRSGQDAYMSALRQLEDLSAAKVTALQAPGPVLLKLTATGFGVRLPG